MEQLADQDQDFGNFVGTSAPKFANTQYRLKTGRKSDFGWLPLLFPLAWASYYKYTFGIVIGLVSTFLSLLTGLILVRYDHATEVLQNPVEADAALEYLIIGWLLLILVNVFTGYYLKPLYVRYVLKKTEQLKKYESDPEALKTLFKDVGGVSRSGMTLAIFAILTAWIAPEAYRAAIFPEAADRITAEVSELTNQPEMESEELENSEPSPTPIFTAQAKEQFIKDHTGIENFKQLTKLCERPRMAEYINPEIIALTAQKIKELDVLSSTSYGDCYQVSDGEIMALKNEGARRFKGSTDGKMIGLADSALADRSTGEQILQGCLRLPSIVDQVYVMGIEEGKIFPKDCPR